MRFDSLRKRDSIDDQDQRELTSVGLSTLLGSLELSHENQTIESQSTSNIRTDDLSSGFIAGELVCSCEKVCSLSADALAQISGTKWASIVPVWDWPLLLKYLSTHPPIASTPTNGARFKFTCNLIEKTGICIVHAFSSYSHNLIFIKSFQLVLSFSLRWIQECAVAHSLPRVVLLPHNKHRI